MKKYFQLTTAGRTADVIIYGDITSWEWLESDVSSYTLSKAIAGLDVDTINVHINSYGGEVAEGLAIYNALKNHPAIIRTVCDGFACSAASVVFMAGDEREMNEASLLMVHNAWTYAAGNAAELRKVADDIEIITQASVNAYMSVVSISEDDLKALMNNETWILPSDAVEKGFATAIIADKSEKNVSQSVKRGVVAKLTANSAFLATQSITVEVDTDAIAQKVFDRIVAFAPLKSDPDQITPMNFLTALMGRKD